MMMMTYWLKDHNMMMMMFLWSKDQKLLMMMMLFDWKIRIWWWCYCSQWWCSLIERSKYDDELMLEYDDVRLMMVLIKRSEDDDNDEPNWKIRVWWWCCCWSKGQSAEDDVAERKVKVLKILILAHDLGTRNQNHQRIIDKYTWISNNWNQK